MLVARVRRSTGRGMLNPLRDSFWFVALVALGGGWGFARPELFSAAPYTMVLLFGLLHVDMAVHLMVCHICNMVCRPFR